MRDHGTEVVVAKNAGGKGAVAKIAAARALGLPVVMIDRPAIPPREVARTVAEVMAWLGV
jgi:precorrin-6A/cobalt-precorrin-6A reductase